MTRRIGGWVMMLVWVWDEFSGGRREIIEDTKCYWFMTGHCFTATICYLFYEWTEYMLACDDGLVT
jgi:hypothetical protein